MDRAEAAEAELNKFKLEYARIERENASLAHKVEKLEADLDESQELLTKAKRE